MPSTKEIDRELCEKLFDLLLIKRELSDIMPDTKIKALERAVRRVRSAMTKEQIAWVEEQVSAEEV